ncbi:O-antigen ligase family protein [Vibrio sp. TRT 17S01]|uniref:O-antigen ligase family protein n=1 Tax=Vibrio sp. TRT 17S01 TaxID=3418505 RepID=UPI003CF84EFB
MSSTINKDKLISILFSIPILWMATGMLWDGDGDMRLVPIVLLVVMISLLFLKIDNIKKNFKNNFWLKLILINSSFGVIAYLCYGFDSRELRATLVVLFLFLAMPIDLLSKKNIRYFIFISSLTCFLYGFYFQVLNHSARGVWPINAIPFATISGLISIISFVSLFSKNEKNNYFISLMSLIFSFGGIILSQSRGPLLSVMIIFFVITFLFLFVKKKKHTVVFIFSFIFISFCLTKVPLISQRLDNTYDEYNKIRVGNLNTSIGMRFQMQNIAFELWKQKPILGYGKNIKREFARLEKKKIITPKVYRLISMTFHNGYLDKFVLYGIPGGLIFLTFLFYPIYLSRQYSLKEGSALLWAPALFMILCNLTDAPFINAQAAIYYMFIIGAVSMMLKNEKEQRLENV